MLISKKYPYLNCVNSQALFDQCEKKERQPLSTDSVSA